MTQTFHDPLVAPDATGLPERFFDRFMFNMHAPEATAPYAIVGLGLYPPRDVIDGFVIAVTDTEQRNLRFSTELHRTDGSGTDPLSFEVVEPLAAWRLKVGPNPTGLELDVLWRARTAPWHSAVEVDTAGAEATSFDHLVQSGRYTGTLTLDGEERSIDGWYGQRDRSRGVRTMSGGQGIHIWYQAQFPDRAVGFLLVEGRDGSRMLLEGSVLAEDGSSDDIVDVMHELSFDEDLDLIGGRVVVRTAGGATYRIDADARRLGGGYMAGGGYGGHHGRPRGRDHVEHDVYPLDGSVTQRTLDSSLTDRLASFDWEGTPGSGIFEFALSRSSSYAYRPNL